MPARTIKVGWRGIQLKLFGSLILASALGCGHERANYEDGLTQLILPPANKTIHEKLPASEETGPELDDGNQPQLEQPKLAPVEKSETACEPARTLTLPEAIDTAFQLQPRLRVYFESVEQARRGEDIAFAPFLPTAVAGYQVGGFDLNVGGTTLQLGQNLPGFIYEPFLGATPVGLKIDTGFELAELKVQWLICDFGRRLGRYRQAGIGVDIAGLQAERAYQTVANEVSVAYYQVLRTRALRKTAQDAVRRAEDDLDVARKLEKGGAIEKEKRLRIEVQLADSQRSLDAAEGAEAVAVAALNLAIGLNVNGSTNVVETSDIPPFTQSLIDCLQAAVSQRREFQVARRSIAEADEGRRVAKADFAPRITAEGALVDFEQSSPRGHLDLPVGYIKLEWGLFEGGKRVAELRISDSKVRAAVAQAESIADTIAFQVTEAYRNLITAQLGIKRSRPAVAQAEETYRFVKAREEKGAALPSEITDAESALTRAQQNYLNSIHDYLIGLARLQYAMGIAPEEMSHPKSPP